VAGKDFSPLPQAERQLESTQDGLSYFQDVLRRFKGNKLAMASLFVIALILLSAWIGPSLTQKSYDAQQLNLRNMPPRIEIQTAANGDRFYVHPELRVLRVDGDGAVGEAVEPVKKLLADRRYEYEIDGAPYTLSFVDGVAFLDGEGNPLPGRSVQWNKNYLLGTDSVGRDILTRLLYGGRISLLVAFVTSFFTLVIGILYGGIAGYYGGNVDVLMMRLVEILMSIPSTIYVILLMVYFGQGIYNILIAMAATSWLGMAQLVRAQVLSLKEQEFVLAARIAGLKPFRIILRHLLPNCVGPVIVSATLSIPGAIATEAFMSFIGLGVAPPMPSWGILSNDGIGAIRSAPYQILLPSAAICLTMFAFSFIGDGLRDALDPRLRT